MHLVQGILLALLQRERTGDGQKVSVSLYNSMLAMQMQEAAMIMMADSEVNWAAMPLTGVFETQDGALVLVGAFKANPLRDICAALGPARPLAATRASHAGRSSSSTSPSCTRCSASASRATPREHWLARLEEQDLLCAPVRDMREALVDPQTLHNDMILEGRRRRAGRCASSPARSGCRARRRGMRRAPPRLGEHTAEVLAEARAPGRRSGVDERSPARSSTMSPRVTIDRPEVHERGRPRDRARAAAHLDRDRSRRRRARWWC